MSGRSVFYAWQSDRPGKCNHYFIRDAAEAAIKALKAELSVEAAPRLDHDTKDVPGIPDVSGTILSKIESCDVFLADVSMVGATPTESKLLPNPNVMIELGYALKALGDEGVVLVMNTAFGGPGELPFDLRNRRHPIQYSLEPSDGQNSTEIRDELAGQLKQAFRAILNGVRRTSRSAEEQAARSRAAEERRGAKHRELLELTEAGLFNKLTARGGRILVTVLPEAPLLPALDFGNPLAQDLMLGTLVSGPKRGDLYGQKLVASDVDVSNDEVFSVAELQDDGTVFAADCYLLAGTPSERIVPPRVKDVKGYVPSVAYEEEVAKAVRRYVRMLREAGAPGSVLVTLSLCQVRDFVMAVDSMTLMRTRGARKCEEEFGIHPKPVSIPEGADLETVGGVAELLKPAFDHIWREFGFDRSLNFTEAGNWKPKQ